ncbi:diguanylate cyclase [Glaciecola sp. SC05]|uniref:GGDEF domain-containing response regulator n=1 Tax=Glaciecola sp. SC05 TaxID=1987355 RepID=UPI003527CEB7
MTELNARDGNIPEAVQQQYKADLKVLVRAWSKARVSKTKSELATFQQQLDQTSKEYDSLDLNALHQILQTMQRSCDNGLEGKNTIAKTSADMDWLMNQLIRSNQISPDPFLSEANSLDEYLPKSSKPMAANVHKAIKVAIIDDEPSVGGAMRLMLEQFAYETTLFESINEFEMALTDGEPDLVLLDICMPKTTQSEVFDFARQLSLRGIKVITCSSLFNFETRLQAVRAGVSDYAVKPLNPYVLVEKISRALKRNINNAYQIVLLDDQESMGEFYQAVFSQVHVDFHFFNTAERLIAALEYLQPDLFLLDRVMPSVNGLEVAEMIRQDAKFDFAPIVFLTADEQLDTKLKVLAHGGDDLIAKVTPAPLVLEQVLARLERSAFIKSFVSKDPLTGVLNHGQIVEAANHQLRLNKRHANHCALAMVDVDFFKDVNDNYGHSAGDMVLNGLGQLLKSSVRETDYVGRYGGEEFIILFVDCDAEQAIHKINLIREKCSQMRFVQDNPDIAITFSGGLVSLEDHKSLPKAISEADRLLYLAKEAGRNQVKMDEK